MKAIPLELKAANAFVEQLHRHHSAVIRDKYRIGCEHNGKLVGVVQVSRPRSRRLDDEKTLEVVRLCTDGTYNACSFLYSAAARVAKELGYSKIITYILQSESGDSLKASGWHLECERCGLPQDNSLRKKNRQSNEQISLFEKKSPPAEYKQRWARILRSD